MVPTTITGWVSDRVLFSVHAFSLQVIIYMMYINNLYYFFNLHHLLLFRFVLMFVLMS